MAFRSGLREGTAELVPSGVEGAVPQRTSKNGALAPEAEFFINSCRAHDFIYEIDLGFRVCQTAFFVGSRSDSDRVNARPKAGATLASRGVVAHAATSPNQGGVCLRQNVAPGFRCLCPERSTCLREHDAGGRPLPA